MRTKTVIVIRLYDGWFCSDEKAEHPEHFFPEGFVLDAMGGRMEGFFRAVWSIDGWKFRRFMVHAPPELQARFQWVRENLISLARPSVDI